MLKWILFLFFNLEALEISLTSAKENFQKYSTLHLKNKTPFLCQEIKDDFNIVTKIVCAFNKKPTTQIETLQNSFFKIENKVKKKTFFIIITPFEKIKLFPMIFDMTKDDTVYQADISMARHWMILGYIEELPFIKKEVKVDTAINFPFQLSVDSLPFVGGLDIKGNPVHIQRVGDVKEYLKIKKLYKEKKYEKCMELINDIVEEYPHSLFMAELFYYKIRVYSKLDDYDNVISMSKEFLREYSADENIPEVLASIANSYAHIGLNTDADYFFDRLFNEHDSTKYAKWGYIYKGEMLEASGSDIKALTYYKKALNETNEIQIAVTAAYKLARYKVMNAKDEEASLYVMKIAKAKPEFFMDDLKTSMDMMYAFADYSSFKTAATIAKCILDETNKQHDEYERLLKDRGLWLSKSDNKKMALDALNDYLAVFDDGLYEGIVSIAKDELFFDTSDANFSVKLAKFNILIEEYANDTIGNRAIYEKAKLLLENEKYTDVLDMEISVLQLDADFYEDKEDIIVDSAIGVMTTALKNRKCQKVLSISDEYNITLSNEWDDGVYECAMMGGNYLLAKKVTARNLNTKKIDLRKEWLYRHIMVDFATGNYSEVIDASKELIVLIEDSKDKKYKDIYRTLFDTYQRLEQTSKLLPQIIEIQKIFENDYIDIERYIAVMSIGEQNKDDTIVITYGEKVASIQNKSSSYAQSPFVEFTLYQAYLHKENLDKALAIIKSLNTVDISKDARARQKYLLGTVLSKLWREEDAQIAYQESIDADSSSPWAELAKSAMSI